MRAFARFFAVLVLALVGGPVWPSPCFAETAFTVSMPRPETHLLEIEMAVAPFPALVRSFELVMPAWAPGSYFIRDFARNVRDVSVLSADGTPLAVSKVEKGRWRASSISRDGERGPFRVRYRVWAGTLSPRTSHLDATHAYGNGTSLFFYVEGRKDEPHAVRFVLPPGWRVDVALPEVDGLFRARGYDELVDSPFECGTQRTADFVVRGVPHRVAVWGSGNEDLPRLARELTRLVEAGAGLFGTLPYERYLFIVHLAEGAGGALEHASSQTCGFSPWEFRPEKKRREALALFAHELFHAWIVKRIHPAVLGPFDYTREVYTRDLWAMEGLASYYQWLVLVRSGLAPPKEALEDWSRDLKGHVDQPGTGVQSAEAASFDAWIRAYRPDENSPNVSESYYRRGSLISLGLDLAIRRGTANAKSLDDVLRRMWERWGIPGKGYPDGEWERAVAEATGWGPKEYFDLYVRGTRTPPFEGLLPAAGLLLHEKPEKDEDDEVSGEKAVRRRSDFGIKASPGRGEAAGRLLVSEVYAGRAAYDAGIDAGDELVAIDGVRADEGQLVRIERDSAPGTVVRVHLFRRGRLVEVELPLGGRRAFTYEIVPDPKAPDGAKALFTSWMGRPFPVVEEGKGPAQRLEKLE